MFVARHAADRVDMATNDTVPRRSSPPTPTQGRLWPTELERRLEAHLLIARKVRA